MKLKNKLKITFIIGIFIVLIFQSIAANLFKKYLVINLKNQILSSVELASKSIDRDLLESLINSVSKNKLYNNTTSKYLIQQDSLLAIEQEYSYQTIVKELNLIRNHSYGLIHYAYIIYPTKNKNIVRFLVDADITMDKVIDQKVFHKKITNIAPFTKMYDITNQPALKMSIITKSCVISKSYVDDEEYSTKSYMAFAPIFAKNNEYIGTLGIDVSKEVVDKVFLKFYLMAMMFVILLLLFFILIYFESKKTVIMPLHNLSDEIIEIEESNFEKRLDVKSKNVIGKLRRTINNLADRIQKNNEKLFKQNEIIQMEKEEMLITLRSIADGVIIANQMGKIIFMNRAAENITEIPEEEAIGKPVEDIFTVYDRLSLNKIENPLLKVIETSKVESLKENVLFRTKKGVEKFISDSAAPVIIDGTLKAAVLVFRDITNDEKIETELINAQKLESLNVLTGGVAHDFNNFLTAIIGNTSILKYKLKDKIEPSIMKIITRVEDASSKAIGLSEQLLNFSKSDTLQKEEGNIFELLKRSMKFSLSGKNVSQSILSKGKISSVKFNPSQMTQVFNNLFINGAQSMPNGGSITCVVENVNLENHLGLTGDFVKITISDQGEGISKEDIDKIFDIFFTTKKTGSGIGLSVVKRIIKDHDGEIEVNSNVNVGTNFVIYLPAIKKYVELEKENDGIFENTNPNNYILIMDDESSILESLKGMLEMLHYPIIPVMRGENAIAEFKKYLKTATPFVLAILDRTIKDGMGGVETAKILKELDPNIKIICSSGYYSDKNSLENIARNSDAFLRKPYKIEELSKLIKDLLED